MVKLLMLGLILLLMQESPSKDWDSGNKKACQKTGFFKMLQQILVF
jgi:hypothetical protein